MSILLRKLAENFISMQQEEGNAVSWKLWEADVKAGGRASVLSSVGTVMPLVHTPHLRGQPQHGLDTGWCVYLREASSCASSACLI